MPTIKLSEAKAHLGRYAREAADGQSFIISEHNRPIAQLSPIPETTRGVRPKIGLREGEVRIPDNFDDPIPEIEEAFYGK